MDLYLQNKCAVVTGGGGAICGAIAAGLVAEGVRVALWDVSEERARQKASEIGDGALAVECDVTDRESVKRATKTTLNSFGTIDILVNGAGGSRPETTTTEDLSFFDIGADAMKQVMSLNYLSTVIVTQEVGRTFADSGRGVIVNIASIAGLNPLTRALTYSDGKAAVVSFTKWLAVHMATEYSPCIRVNAIAPGFILTDQNRFLLVDEATGKPSLRGETILDQVPMKRLGDPAEIVGASLWLVSDHASFVTGTVLPVDGGYTAFSGV